MHIVGPIPLIGLWAVLPYWLFTHLVSAKTWAGLVVALITFLALLLSWLRYGSVINEKPKLVKERDVERYVFPQLSWFGTLWAITKIAVVWPLLAMLKLLRALVMNGWGCYYGPIIVGNPNPPSRQR